MPFTPPLYRYPAMTMRAAVNSKEELGFKKGGGYPLSRKNPLNSFLTGSLKGTLQKLLKGEGYPPFPLRVLGQNDFLLRGGGGYPPNKNSAKKQAF